MFETRLLIRGNMVAKTVQQLSLPTVTPLSISLSSSFVSVILMVTLNSKQANLTKTFASQFYSLV